MNTAFWGGIVFSMFSLYFLKYAWTSFRQFGRSESWPTAEGTIRDCVLRVSPKSDALRFFDVKYEYSVGGETYSNNRVALYTIVRKDEAETLAGEFTPGTVVLVYYDPECPKVSCLVPGAPATKKYSDLIIATLGLLVGVGTAIGGYAGIFG